MDLVWEVLFLSIRDGQAMWYVMWVRARHEEEIIRQCKKFLKDDEEVFVMYVERLRRSGKEWIAHRELAFKNYVFADVKDVDNFRLQIRKIPDLTKLLQVGEEIISIYPDEENLLRTIGGEDHVIRPSRGHYEGEKIIVTDGPLKGQESVIKWVDRRQRIVGIEVQLMNRTVEVKLGAEFVKTVE
ncbi:MAG: antiterminator LoaP [Lachnospiraceae bacterium]|nr:antiterminator LoaP [Lachnospiraceae bacterium]